MVDARFRLHEAEEATRDGAARFVSVQNEYSLLHREPEQDALPECERAGLALIPYFPLANGLLTGKYRRGESGPAGSRLDSGRGDRLLSEHNLEVAEDLIGFSEGRTRYWSLPSRGCSRGLPWRRCYVP